MTETMIDGATVTLQLDAELAGKTIRGVRPTHENGPVPDVNVLFTDDSALTISVKDGVYFEGCLINTLRRAQPTSSVLCIEDNGHYTLQIRSRTFPLMTLLAVNKELPHDEYPFVFTWRTRHGG